MKNIKKITAAAVFCIIVVLSSAFAPVKTGKVILIVSVEGKNFAEWKKVFDAGSPVREKAGIKVISICSATENANQVVVVEEAENAKAASDFLAVLRAKQKDGDMSKLDVKIYDKAE